MATCYAYVHKDLTLQYRFKKNEKRESSRGQGSNFLNLMRTYYVKGPLRMLRPGGEIVLRKRYFHFCM